MGKIFEPKDAFIADKVLTDSLTQLLQDELNPHIWIGVHDKTNKSFFSYELGGSLHFENWFQNETTADKSGGSCVQAIHSIEAKWKVMPCTGYDVPSVCERLIEKGILHFLSRTASSIKT